MGFVTGKKSKKINNKVIIKEQTIYKYTDIEKMTPNKQEPVDRIAKYNLETIKDGKSNKYSVDVLSVAPRQMGEFTNSKYREKAIEKGINTIEMSGTIWNYYNPKTEKIRSEWYFKSEQGDFLHISIDENKKETKFLQRKDIKGRDILEVCDGHSQSCSMFLVKGDEKIRLGAPALYDDISFMNEVKSFTTNTGLSESFVATAAGFYAFAKRQPPNEVIDNWVEKHNIVIHPYIKRYQVWKEGQDGKGGLRNKYGEIGAFAQGALPDNPFNPNLIDTVFMAGYAIGIGSLVTAPLKVGLKTVTKGAIAKTITPQIAKTTFKATAKSLSQEAILFAGANLAVGETTSLIYTGKPLSSQEAAYLLGQGTKEGVAFMGGMQLFGKTMKAIKGAEVGTKIGKFGKVHPVAGAPIRASKGLAEKIGSKLPKEVPVSPQQASAFEGISHGAIDTSTRLTRLGKIIQGAKEIPKKIVTESVKYADNPALIVADSAKTSLIFAGTMPIFTAFGKGIETAGKSIWHLATEREADLILPTIIDKDGSEREMNRRDFAKEMIVSIPNGAKMGLWLGPTLKILQVPGTIASDGSKVRAVADAGHGAWSFPKVAFSRNSAEVAQQFALKRAVVHQEVKGIIEGNIPVFSKQGVGAIGKTAAYQMDSILFVSGFLAGTEQVAKHSLMHFAGISEKEAHCLASKIAFAALFFLPSAYRPDLTLDTSVKIKEVAEAKSKDIWKADARTPLNEFLGKETADLYFRGYESRSIGEVQKTLFDSILTSQNTRSILAADAKKTLREIGIKVDSRLAGIKVSDVRGEAETRFVSEIVSSKTVNLNPTERLKLLNQFVQKNLKGVDFRGMEVDSKKVSEIAARELAKGLTTEQLFQIQEGMVVKTEGVEIKGEALKNAIDVGIRQRIVRGDRGTIEKIKATEKEQKEIKKLLDKASLQDLRTLLKGEEVRIKGKKISLTKIKESKIKNPQSLIQQIYKKKIRIVLEKAKKGEISRVRKEIEDKDVGEITVKDRLGREEKLAVDQMLKECLLIVERSKAERLIKDITNPEKLEKKFQELLGKKVGEEIKFGEETVEIKNKAEKEDMLSFVKLKKIQIEEGKYSRYLAAQEKCKIKYGGLDSIRSKIYLNEIIKELNIKKENLKEFEHDVKNFEKVVEKVSIETKKILLGKEKEINRGDLNYERFLRELNRIFPETSSFVKQKVLIEEVYKI